MSNKITVTLAVSDAYRTMSTFDTEGFVPGEDRIVSDEATAKAYVEALAADALNWRSTYGPVGALVDVAFVAWEAGEPDPAPDTEETQEVTASHAAE